MDIKRLLRSSGMNPDLEDAAKLESLQKDIDNIVELIAQLPEISKEEKHVYTRFMQLAEDEYGKDAKKEEILSNTESLSNGLFKIG